MELDDIADVRAWQLLVDGYLDDLWADAVLAGAGHEEAAEACEATFLVLLEALDRSTVGAGRVVVSRWVRHTFERELERAERLRLRRFVDLRDPPMARPSPTQPGGA